MRLIVMLDLILAAIFCLLVYMGLRQGFVRTAMSAVALCVALGIAAAAAATLTPPVVNGWAAAKTENFLQTQADRLFPDQESQESVLSMYTTAMNAVRRVLGVGGATNSDLSKAVTAGCNAAGITDEATITAIKRVVNDAFRDAEATLKENPEAGVDVHSIIDFALRQAGVTNDQTVEEIASRVSALSETGTLAALFSAVAGEDTTDAEGNVDVMAGLSAMTARIWVGILLFAVVFGVAYALLRVAIDQLEFIDRIHIVGTLNTVLGGVLGAGAGLIVLLIPIVAVVKIGGKLTGVPITSEFFSGSMLLGLLSRIYPG